MNADPNLDQARNIIEAGIAEPAKRPTIAGFFDEATHTISYVVHDPSTARAAVIDSVLDYDCAAGRTSFRSADRIVEYVEKNELTVDWLIETHAHADHISAAPYLQDKLGGKLAIGADIVRIQEVFGKLFNAGTEFQRDGSQFDRLFSDGDTSRSARSTRSRFMFPATRRPTWRSSSVTRPLSGTPCSCPISALRGPISPAATRASCTARSAGCWNCRARRDCSCATITSRRGATAMRGRRRSASSASRMSMSATGSARMSSSKCASSATATLAMPELIMPSVQVNIRGGRLPEPEDNGVSYIKIPLNAV